MSIGVSQLRTVNVGAIVVKPTDWSDDRFVVGLYNGPALASRMVPMSSVNESLKAPRPERTNHSYEFGSFVIDTVRHLVLRDSQPVAFTPKTYDTLLVLVESGGRLLSKEELMKALWPNSFVEESNLTQQISVVRKALGETPGEDRYIVTVAGRGYRFAAPVKARVTEYSETAAEAAASPARDEGSRTSIKEPAETPYWQPGTSGLPVVAEPQADWKGTRRLKRIALPALVLLVIIVAGLTWGMRQKQSIGTRSSREPHRLAILPFRNIRNDPDSDFLALSLADAIVTRLSYVSALTVRPSSAVEKYRRVAIDLQKAAADLNVDTLLAGNFVRDGDDLRITSELIDVKTQRVIWKKAFDVKYERLLTVQDSVAQQIVKALDVSLSPSQSEQLRADYPMDPLAYEYYLRGVDLYAKSDFKVAIKMLEKSAEINPDYALTWAQLGRSYNATASFQFGGSQQYRKAQAAYERALALRPTQIETRIYMANMFTDTGRVEQAVPLLRQALKTNPNYAETHWELGYAYRFAGALKESVLECERARHLDSGVKLYTSAPNGYLYLGQYDTFLRNLPKGDDSAFILFYRGFGEYYRENWDQATRDFDRAFELDRSLLQTQVGKALSYGIKRQRPQGLEILQAAESKISERDVGDAEAIYKVAQAYGVLGDAASALRLLRHSIENGFFPYPYLANDPLLSSIRKEREFDQLVALARRRYEAFRRAYL